jgi:outer membrane receptor protein involved in Fe transport
MKKALLRVLLLSALVFASGHALFAQVTTAAMTGVVKDEKGEGLPGANVIAIHGPSGTRYGASTQLDGRYTIPGMRIGGPYKVTVTFVGYKEQVFDNIFLSLGTAADVSAKMTSSDVQLSEVVVQASKNDVFSSERTGAATNIGKDQINNLPTLSRSINDFTRLTPQASGTSFGGQDSRLNNITIDGSLFNNSFGLAGQPGGRTGSSPISLDAIEEVQVNLAPFDVRQAGFVGAGVNAVTRSGTNEFSGSLFYNTRNKGLVGNRAKGNEVFVGDFNLYQAGFRVGGPIIKNKLFFFLNGEQERETFPGTTFRANAGGETVTGNTTRVLASDLDEMSTFLRSRFNYETGPYQDYNNQARSDKFLIRLDYNINDKHKLSLRYSHLDSQTDILVSNSTTIGGDRRGNLAALNYQNSNYIQLEKIRSVIGELNSNFGKLSNNLIVGYTYQNEDRGSRGSFFPLVEILNGGQTYMTFGFEPFTPSNKLNYSTFQIQDNLTYYGRNHVITAGFSVERLAFENVFFPFSQGRYAFNSLADFYTAANAALATPNLTVSPVNVRNYRLNFSALPGGAEPVQPTEVTYAGVYLQDEWSPSDKFKLTFGLRADIPFFGNTALNNPIVEGLSFRDETGATVRYNTSKLPDPNILWSPRLGFNLDVTGDRKTQLRGGTGIFTGRPAFVWISNQVGNNGVLTGLINVDNTTAFPFSPDPRRHIPANPTLPSSFNIAVTDPEFRFPQVWRTNLAVDQKLPGGIVGTLEFIYTRNVNQVYYIDANREPATQTFSGPDNRPRFPGSGLTGATQNNAIRINDNITDAIVLKNTNQGSAYTITARLEKNFDFGLNIMAAYNFGSSRNLIDPGSIAFTSWSGNFSTRGGNLPDLAFSDNDQRHRLISAISYRKNFGRIFSLSANLFWEGRNQGRFTYRVNGDMNGDGVNGNDLMFVPNNASEMVFLPLVIGTGPSARTFTPEEQAQAFNNFINQDEYLSSRRGQYTERNGAIFPWVYRADFSLILDVKVYKKNTVQFRADIFNVGNLLNQNWGVGNTVITTTPVAAAGVNAQGVPQYRMVNIGTTTNPQLPNTTFRTGTFTPDVYRVQFGVRYTFN